MLLLISFSVIVGAVVAVAAVVAVVAAAQDDLWYIR